MKVIILTTRDADAVRLWLLGNSLDDLVNWVTRQKSPALAYIDDRGICFKGDFWATLWQLKRFVPYYRVTTTY